jgi:hypothetical protein
MAAKFWLTSRRMTPENDSHYHPNHFRCGGGHFEKLSTSGELLHQQARASWRRSKAIVKSVNEFWLTTAKLPPRRIPGEPENGHSNSEG